MKTTRVDADKLVALHGELIDACNCAKKKDMTRHIKIALVMVQALCPECRAKAKTEDKEIAILVSLYLDKAVSSKTATNQSMSHALVLLVKQGQVVKTIGGKYFLTPMGQMIAKGAID